MEEKISKFGEDLAASLEKLLKENTVKKSDLCGIIGLLEGLKIQLVNISNR